MTKRLKSILLTGAVFLSMANAQHTFSIVAVDSVTGMAGSAGASCIDTSVAYNIHRISELVPGTGAINAQAWWDFENLANAKLRMLAGDSPQEIIDWLMDNDSENNPQKMQYGIVDLNGGSPRSAAFSGSSATDWKGHVTGPGYAIQGNILIGPQVVDSMESKFLAAEGLFMDKLMAALQGANFAGADKRCLNEGVSSRSAYIRVALPEDEDGEFYLDLEVPATPYGVEPLDELQLIYNDWREVTGVKWGRAANAANPRVKLHRQGGQVEVIGFFGVPREISIYDVMGRGRCGSATFSSACPED